MKVVIRRIALRDGSLSLSETRNTQSRAQRVDHLNLTADLTLGADHFISAGIMALSFKTDRPDVAVDSLRGKIGYHVRKKQFSTENLRLRASGADLTFDGRLGWDSDEPKVDMRVVIQTLPIAKIGRALNWPVLKKGDLKGSLYVRGTPNRIYHELELGLGRASLRTGGDIDELLTGRLRINISGGLRQVSPQRLPWPAFEKFAGEINCDFKMAGADLRQPDRKGALSLVLKPSTLFGYRVEQGSLLAEFERSRVVLKESRVSGPAGRVRIADGLAEILDSDRAKKLSLNVSFENADLERIFKRPDLSGKVNLDVEASAEFPALERQGADAARMSARISAKIHPSRVMGIRIAGGRLVSTWDGKKMGIEKLEVSGEAGRVSLSGHLVPGARSGQMAYRLNIPRLKNAAALTARLVPDKNRRAFQKLQLAGDVTVSGQLNGRWDRPELSARITGKNLGCNDFSAGAVQVTAIWEGGLKNIRLNAQTKITDFKFKQAGLSEADLILHLSPQKARADITLVQEKKATARVIGEITDWARPARAVAINTLQLSFNDEGVMGRTFRTISNRRPIYINLADGSPEVSAFELISGPTTFSLEGKLSPAGELKTKIGLNKLDLEQISRLWQRKGHIAGILSAESEITGTLARPVIQARLKIENGSGYDLSFSKIACTLDYRQDQVSFKASGEREGSKIIDINGRAGIDFSLAPFQMASRPKQFEITMRVDGVRPASLPVPKPAGVHFDGVLALNARAAGDLDAPEIQGELSFKDGRFSLAGAPAESLNFKELKVAFDYRNSRAAVDAALFLQNRKGLDIKGAAGLQISLVPLRLIPLDTGLKLAVNAHDLKLSLLPIPIPSDLKLDGILNLKAAVSGSVASPNVAGSLTLREGYLALASRSLSYEELTADIEFSPGKVTINGLQLKGDKEGSLAVSGGVETEGLKLSAFNIRLSGENVYVPYKSFVYARIKPQLRLFGGPKAPQLNGTVTVTESRVYIDQLAQGGPAEIQIDAGRPADDQLILLDERKPAGSAFFNALSADVGVDVPKNAWLKGQDLNVEIAGKINLKKTPEKPFTLLGSLNTVRGTYAFQSKLFKISRGNVDFIGLEEPNPNLDIEAETRIKKVDIKLRISGTARNMVLTLASDPPLEQSDIIAYLVFGRPVNDLNNQQGFSAEQAALNITSQMAVSELKNILGEAFLLDTLNLESGGEDVSQGAISAGKYVSPDVFVLYRHRFKADEPDQVEITYEINRNFSLETQLGDEKSSGVDFVWEFDF